jgi:uncharacterized membrane protein (UPF0127 family)
MNFSWTLGWVVIGTCLLAGCGRSVTTAAPPATNRISSVPTKVQPKLPTIKVWLGSQELMTEVAGTDPQIQTGMMFRETIAENEAMIFVFDRPEYRAFWMKNVSVPLSCAYIDPDGVILEIHDMTPQETKPIESATGRIQFVLETKQGWFERNKIATGATIRTERGSLAETFFRRP